MEQMDTQLQSLDDIMSRVREQNNAHHTAHTSSLNALSNTVKSSYSSIGEHLSTSFARVQSLESDMSAQTTAIKETLPDLQEDANIRAPLQELRGMIGSQNLMEYNPTGETPQRASYTIPEKLPRTEAQDTLLSRLRDRPVTADALMRLSPSKQRVFNDATQSTLPSEDPFSDISKPIFPRSQSVTTASAPIGASLRELDVNIVAQENHTEPLPTILHSDAMAIAAPPSKRHRGEDSKLPMKRMGRKTVGGEGKGDRENITITSFSSSIGPPGRKLRSHGST
jgi:kinesin family protein 11